MNTRKGRVMKLFGAIQKRTVGSTFTSKRWGSHQNTGARYQPSYRAVLTFGAWGAEAEPVEAVVVARTLTRSSTSWRVMQGLSRHLDVRQERSELHAREALEALFKNEESVGLPSQPMMDYIQTLRAPAVSWALDMCDGYNYGLRTAALAVSLLDRVASSAGSSNRLFEALALSAVTIAAKLEECEKDVPSAKDLAKASGWFFSPGQITRCEVGLLSFLGWRARLPTPAHFLECFLALPESRLGLRFASFRPLSPSFLLKQSSSSRYP